MHGIFMQKTPRGVYYAVLLHSPKQILLNVHQKGNGLTSKSNQNKQIHKKLLAHKLFSFVFLFSSCKTCEIH